MENIYIVGAARFTVLTEHLIRLEYDAQQQFEDRTTQTVINRQCAPVVVDVVETPENFELSTPALRLRYQKNMPFSAATLQIELKNNLTAYHNRFLFGQKLETLKGTARTLDEEDGAVELEEGIISREGMALLDDSYSLIVEADELLANRRNQVDQYFFGYGHNYRQALYDYFVLTGFPPLLPRFALGNWWSRFWRYDEKSYVAVMDKFAARKIPIAVSVLDMDWHTTHVPARFGSGWTGYTWNRELFPDPEKFLANLHARGLKISLNVHPAEGIRAFEESYPRVAKRLQLNQKKEEPATFALENKNFRTAYFKDVHEPLEKQGVDFWWIDWQQGTTSTNTNVDPLWLLNHYHYKMSKKNGTPLILSRYAGPGSQRYPVGFSGDTFISWQSLNFQPYFTATAANIGYTWWSHDIGGHMHGVSNDELIVRWLQFGAISPINRLHSSDNLFASKEPWAYKKATEELMTKALIFRHQLLPYLYTMNVLTHEVGRPLVQPLYYELPETPQAYEHPNEYYFGTQFLALPITEQTDRLTHFAKVSGYLPKGTWVDVFTGITYQGETTMNFYRPLENYPLLVRVGTIIPLDIEPEKTKSALPEKITWLLYPGADAEFELIEDGKTGRAATRINYDDKAKKVEITVSGEQDILPTLRCHQIKVCFAKSVKEVTIIGSGQVVLDFTTGPFDWQKLLFTRLDTMDLAYDLKRQIYQELIASRTYRDRAIIIQRLTNPALQGVLYEVINSITE